MAKQKIKKRYPEGIVTIKATFNNTLIAISTPSGDVLCQSSAGCVGFKNARKGTPFAAQQAAEMVAKEAQEKFGMELISEARTNGLGSGYDPALKAIDKFLKIKKLRDKTRLPHGGCRQRKKRRV